LIQIFFKFLKLPEKCLWPQRIAQSSEKTISGYADMDIDQIESEWTEDQHAGESCDNLRLVLHRPLVRAFVEQSDRPVKVARLDNKEKNENNFIFFGFKR